MERHHCLGLRADVHQDFVAIHPNDHAINDIAAPMLLVGLRVVIEKIAHALAARGRLVVHSIELSAGLIRLNQLRAFNVPLFVQVYAILRRLRKAQAMSRRPSMARASVTSSAYSRSPPTGSPRAIWVTRTPSGRSSRVR